MKHHIHEIKIKIKICNFGRDTIEYELVDSIMSAFNYDKIKNLKDNKIVFAYVYSHEDYEGSGDSLTKIDGLWYYHPLGHCSCYGPMERYNDSIFGSDTTLKAMSIEQLKQSPPYKDTWDNGFKSLVDNIVKYKL
jgi:hypothetical protein